jgi:predicted nucleic acid-binding Zn ribbon protein
VPPDRPPDPPTGGQRRDDDPQEHRPEGLDLAKNLARATARSSPTKRVRRRGADRRGGPARASGAYPDDRDPQLLDATVSRLVDDHGWDVDLRVAGMFARWSDLVGEEVARHATPESFADGTLVVRTDSTAWATQLKLLAPAVVKRLNEDLGHGTVSLIEVRGPHLPSWKKGPRSVRDGRGPRDTYG